jgi:hypothetical protein
MCPVYLAAKISRTILDKANDDHLAFVVLLNHNADPALSCGCGSKGVNLIEHITSTSYEGSFTNVVTEPSVSLGFKL